MSSDSSTSSIRRFGLYRTIDARTEEFLRLSRKRQLRQGCICAAISTAITVIIVIIIILIYEYSNVSNGHNIKPNWLGLMNQSDPSQFDPSHKTKLKLDRTTIQILPLLLKAFTKNKYFDPEVDESSSPNPNIKEGDTTEIKHNNIFADTRNWMKMPTSRVYAIEFKTSPIVYFKNPTRSLDYYRKIRKIRDYERVMNYVDKMINDKVSSGSTQPMIRTDYKLYGKSFLTSATTPMTKRQTTKPEPNEKKLHLIEPEKQMNCNCSSKISLLIRKLIMSLQKIVPDLVNDKEENRSNCTAHMINTLFESNNHNASNSGHLQKYYKQNQTDMQIATANLKSNKEKLSKPNEMSNTNKHNLSNMLKLLKPNLRSHINHKKIDHELYNLKAFEERPLNYSNNHLEPRNFLNYRQNFVSKTNSERPQYYKRINRPTNKYNLLEKITIIPSSSSSTISSYVIDDDYEDFTQTDPNDISNIFDTLDTHTLELVKNNLISTKSYYIKKAIPGDQIKLTTELNGKKLINTDINPIKYNFQDFKKNINNIIGINSSEGSGNTSQNDTLVVLNINKTGTVSNNEFYSIEEPIPKLNENKYIATIKPNNKRNGLHEDNNQDEFLERENDKLEEEMEKSTNEESSDEDFKDMENIINKLKLSGRSNDKHKSETTNSSELYYWEFIKIREHANNITKGVLSHNRPTYLEMQRNNWKHEENNNIIEYDANINNYIFE